MSANETAETPQPVEEETIEVTAPELPWEIVLNESTTYFQKRPGGGMFLKFAVAIQTPNGLIPIPPAVTIPFGKAGWENFKEEVAKDGDRPAPSRIVRAPSMPTPLLERLPAPRPR